MFNHILKLNKGSEIERFTGNWKQYSKCILYFSSVCVSIAVL